jgi:hypothetical protein
VEKAVADGPAKNIIFLYRSKASGSGSGHKLLVAQAIVNESQIEREIDPV